MYDLIIIGAGTAGLSAAVYALRAGKSVLVLEEKSYGGQIIVTPEIENYPGIKRISGFEFAKGLYEQALELGMKFENVRGIQIHFVQGDEENEGKHYLVDTKTEKYAGRSIILATGAKNRPLGVEREQELIGAGISYCATCDGAFFRGKDVAVVGGGNTALEDALFLSQYCSKVYVIHRRDTFRGEKKRLQLLEKKENVQFVLNSQITALLGESRLEKIEIQNKQTEEKQELEVSGLFIAIGQMPDNKAFSELVKLDENGYLVAGEDCKTSKDGIFAAGDCRTKVVRQLTTAAADGAVAALAACEYMEELL